MKANNLILLIAFLICSCVPPTKFKDLQSESLNCQQERDNLKAENERLSVENKELKATLAVLEKEMAKIGKDSVKRKEELTLLHRQYNQLNKDYDDLQEAHQVLLKGSETEIRRLMDELQTAQKDLQVHEDELSNLSIDIENRKKEIDQMQLDLNQRNARLAEMEKMLNDQKVVLGTLKKKVSDALLGFENQGLTVSQKNGKVYVSLEEKLLFKSGSTEVDPKGISALKKLARVLEQNPDIAITIEGHTDDVPVIQGSAYKDNWDLSVLRATSIVRILLEGSTIDPNRLTTSGRSQYQPVDAAKTSEARQKNRRTEIILSPKLEELYNLIEK
jgi:chemotaxis protein MotB